MGDPLVEVYLFGFDCSEEKGKDVLTVGRKLPGEAMEIINVFIGKEARELYEKLTNRKERTVS